MNVMLLAAGEGRRLRPFTENVPKPAIPFLTTPLAAYSLSLLDQIKIDQLVVNTHHLPLQIEQLFKSLPSQWRSLAFSNEPVLLGSGGGVNQAETWLKGDDDFFLMNADEVILPKNYFVLQEMLSFHQWNKNIATLLVIKHPEVGTRFGGAWTEGNEVKCFSKTPVSGLQGYHYVGVCLLSPRVYPFFASPVREENLLYETLTQAMNAGESVKVFECEAQWFETGDPQSFLSATAQLLKEVTLDSTGMGHEFLRQTVRRFGGHSPVIERDHFELAKKELEIIKSWRHA